MTAADGERIVQSVKTMSVRRSMPRRVSAELPETGERFEGLLPPVVASPAFAIRKLVVVTARRLAYAGIMTHLPA